MSIINENWIMSQRPSDVELEILLLQWQAAGGRLEYKVKNYDFNKDKYCYPVCTLYSDSVWTLTMCVNPDYEKYTKVDYKEVITQLHQIINNEENRQVEESSQCDLPIQN